MCSLYYEYCKIELVHFKIFLYDIIKLYTCSLL